MKPNPASSAILSDRYGCDCRWLFKQEIPNVLPDSPATLESSLNPAELVPFQGCVIPPLSPQWDLSAEDSLVSSHAEAHDGALWEDVAQCQAAALGDSVEANNLVSPQPSVALWFEQKKGD